MTGPAALTQLVGIGLLWIGIHCVGMCGPLLVGLDIAGGTERASVGRGLWRTVQYQLGKAVSYAVLGAFAGLLGAGLETVASWGGGVLAMTLGVVAVVSVIRQRLRWSSSSSSMRTSPLVQIRRRRAPGVLTRGKERLLSAHARWLHLDHPLRPAVTGAVMAFLPCMISLWALGLAAMTGSVLWGALVMVCLALMTTPMLLLVSIFASTFSRMASGHRRRLQQGLTLLAGTWLLLVGAAGLGLLPHQHLAVAGYTVMFF